MLCVMNSVLTVRVMFYACLDIIYLKRECGKCMITYNIKK